MNPYATQLGDDDPHEVIGRTAARLRELWDQLGTDGRKRRPGEGKWTPGEIICHLADTEIAFAFRLRQALAEPHHTIQPFDQDAWAGNYAQLDGQAALQTFSALRKWNLEFLAGLPRDAYSKPLTHPERGQMTFRTLVETMAGHDRNHLQQLEKLAVRAA
jgi:DinB superfamily